MTQGVLLGRRQSSGRHRITLRDENGIVAKTVLTVHLASDVTGPVSRDNSFECRGVQSCRDNNGDAAGEVSPAVGIAHIRELLQEQTHVLTIATGGTSPSGGEDAGGSTQDIDANSRVIGERW